MKRRMILVALLIAALCLLSLTGTAGADEPSGSCGNGLTWSLDEFGVLMITKTGEGDGRMTSHPWTDRASEIGEVFIKEGVTTICKDAFAGCSNIEFISIPGSMEEIAGAFSGCGNFSIFFNGVESEWRNGYLFPIWEMDASYGSFADGCRNRITFAGEEQRANLGITNSDIRVSGAAEALTPDAQGAYTFTANQRICLSFSAPEADGYDKTYRVGDELGNIYWVHPDNTEGRTGRYEEVIGEAIQLEVWAVYVPQNNGRKVLIGKKTVFTLNPESQGDSGISLTADHCYLMDANPAADAGYTFTINIPEGITETDRSIYVSYTDETAGTVELTEKLIRNGNTYTIPSSEMAVGKIHYIYVDIHPLGYDTSMCSQTFIVLDKTGSENLTVQLTKKADGTVPESWQTGEVYTLRAIPASGTPEITGLRLWNGTEWITPQTGSLETDILFREGGKYALTAAATTAAGEEIQATPISVTVAGGNTFDEPFTMSTNKDSYEAGENVLVTFSQPTEAEFFTIRTFYYVPDGQITLYSSTLQATGESTRTVSIPANELGEINNYNYYEMEIVCYSPGYKSLTATKWIGFDLRQPAPAIQVNMQPVFYQQANPQEGDVCTFTVTLPEEVQNASVADWYFYVYNRRYNLIYSTWKSASDEYTGTFTIPMSCLNNGEEHYLRFYLTLENYKTSSAPEKAFYLMDPPDENQTITFTLTDENGEIPENPLINGDYYVKVQAGPNVNMLNVFDGNSWEVVEGNSYTLRGWELNRTDYVVAAKGSTDGGATWTGGYNVAVFNLGVKGSLGKPVFTLDKPDKTYTRGEDVIVTILTEAHATEYTLFSLTGNTANYYANRETDGSGEKPLTIHVPTAHLEPGSYSIHVYNYGEGYRGFYSDYVYFTVTEAEDELQPTIHIYPESPNVTDYFEIYAYLPGAQDARMIVRREDGTGVYESRGYMNYQDLFIWTDGDFLPSAGNYTFAIYKDDETSPSVEASVTVSSRGRLEKPVLTGIPGIVWAGETFSAALQKKDNNAKSYEIRLGYFAENGNMEILSEKFQASQAETIALEIPASAIRIPGSYYIYACARGKEWEPTSSFYYFTVLDPAQQGDADHPIHLAVLDENGNETDQPDQRTWYTANGVQVSVTAENATEIRVWEGNGWRYCIPENGTWRGWLYFGEGDNTLAAQAKYEAEGDWISTSDIITLHIIRRVLPAPNVTTTLTEAPVDRGTVIEFTIGEDPETETEDTESFNYYAKIYAVSAGDELTDIGSSFDWNEQKRKILVPTDNLSSGNYRIFIRDSVSGWEPGERSFDITTKEPQSVPANFRVSSARTLIREPIQIIYYEPGAERTRITTTGEDYYEGAVRYGEAGIWEMAFNEPGTYTLTPSAEFRRTDEQGNSCLEWTEGMPIRVIVTDAEWTNVLYLPEGLTRIEEGAFQGGAFQAVIVPDSCTSIGSMAFAYCPNLKYVSYKEGTEIAEDAFAESDVQVLENR